MASQGTGGYSPSGHWETYANFLAEEGSKDQLRAAMTQSVPDSFDPTAEFRRRNPHLKEDMAFTNPDLAWRWLTSAAAGAGRGPRNPESYVSAYSKNLRQRLLDDYKNNFGEYLDQGVANLRAKKQDALSDDFSNIDAQANARGLLFSGKRLANRARAAAGRSGELSNEVSDYETALRERQKNMENELSEADVADFVRQSDWGNLESSQFYNSLRRRMGDQANKQNNASEMGSGIGTVLGYGAGGGF